MNYIIIIALILVGVFLGTITGLTPGLHINLVAALLTELNINIDPLYTAIIIFSLSITHTFLDAIPSIYLGAPDPSQALNVLPGHKMLLKGKAHYAIFLTLVGSLLCLLLSITLFGLFVSLMKITYTLIKPFIGFVLLTIIMWIIYKQKHPILAVYFFMLSGLLGVIVLNLHNLRNPLFHLLSGLFGISTLAFSLSTPKLPPQDFRLEFNNWLLKSIPISTLMGFFAAFLPGLGSSQSAIIGLNLLSKIKKKITDEDYLILVGGINTSNMLISLASIYSINKARNGSIIAISKIIHLNTHIIIMMLIISLIAGSLSFILALRVSKIFSKAIRRINYRYLVISIIILIYIVSFIFDNILGIVILTISSLIGILANLKSVQKNNLMGVLLLQTLMFFLI